MSWFDKGLTGFLKEAQKKIDKVLDIEEDSVVASSGARTGDNEILLEQPPPPAVEKSKTEPSPPVFDHEEKATSMAVGRSSWGSFTGSFFDNPNAREMITTPPKASTSSTPAAASTAPAAVASAKRQSVTSNSDSVELLSPPTSPCESDLASPSETAAVTSDSVEVISATATSEIFTPDSGTSLPESIVIIASNEACEDEEEEDSMSYNTVMDDTLTAATEDTADLCKQASGDSLGLFGGDADITPRSSAMLGHSSSSNSTMKLLMSMEASTVDSDSTQSFEDVQMQMSSTHSGGSTADKIDLHKLSSSSPPNSNDEMETTTSSDIEIISNPNGDSSSNSTTRTSPLKMKKMTASGQGSAATQGCSTVAPAKKGHYREPSEISILSEDSQSELDKLLHRINELNEILETRELRLLQSERQNASLHDHNVELQAAVEAMKSNSASIDSAEEYTQRLSALEKKFQASIRERDAMRIQIKTLKDELENKIPKDVMAESTDMIAELRLEGEKLSKEILQQSNIIKKLRIKEKSSDGQLKKNKEQIATLTDEVERLKRTLNAKEEVERSQIEAVHKMSSEKRKLDEENTQNRTKIEDLQTKLDTAKAELEQRTRLHTDLSRTAEEASAAKREREQTKAENQEIMLQLSELREKSRGSEAEMQRRERQLREENRELLRRLEAAELRAETSTQEVSLTTIPLMRQLESLQNTLSQRTSGWNKEEKLLLEQLDVSQTRLKSLENVETTFKEKMDLLQGRCLELEEKLSRILMQEEKSKINLHQAQLDYSVKESNLNRQLTTLSDSLHECNNKIKTLEERNKSLEESLETKSETDDLHRELSAAALNEVARLTGVHHDQTQHQQQPHHRPHSPAISFGRNSLEEAMGGSIDWQADDLDCISNSGRHAGAFVHGMQLNFMGSHNATTLEHLQSMLKQRDGELTHLQWELSRLQAERSVQSEEISILTLELENIKDKLQTSEALEKSFDDLQHRYDALLQMYGEKVERTEELELDLVELKEAYKLQIDELLAQPTPPVV